MIDIVIVNWNAGIQLRDAVLSIVECAKGLVSSVVVVDNASTDNSLDLLSFDFPSFPFQLKIIRNSENVGFGSACNQGAREGSAEFLLFLNPDAQLYANSLERSVEYLIDGRHRDVGVVGIQLLDESMAVARSCSRFPSLSIFFAQALGLNRLHAFRHLTQAMVEWPHDTTRVVDQVIGAYFFIRRGLFNTLNGFDERFFVYFEEVDVARRAKLAGYKSVYLSDAQAFHSGGGTSSQVKAHRLFYSLRSRMLYGFKHFDSIRAWALVFVTLVIEPLTRSVFALRRSGLSGLRNTLKGFGMLYADLPQILSLRKKA